MQSFFRSLLLLRLPSTKRGSSNQCTYEWVQRESIEWFLWALLVTIGLTVFNIIYQSWVEKIKTPNQFIILATMDLLVILIGIYVRGMYIMIGLTEEIDRCPF